MGLFDKFKAGLQKSHNKLVHEIKRIVTLSPKLTGETLEELEAALLAADLGMAMTNQIIGAVKKTYEVQGRGGEQIFDVAEREVEKALEGNDATLKKQPDGVTVVSIVGVNGSGKTTTAAKLAHYFASRKQTSVLAACDTFRAAAIEQLKLWGQRLDIPVVSGAYNADPAAVANLVGAVIPERLDACFTNAEPVDARAKVIDMHRLSELGPHDLAADEVDTEVQPAIGGEGDRRRGRDDREDQRQVAPAHEVEVCMIGDELYELHCASLKCAVRAGGRGGSTAPPACG